jgi:hypothetical protein
MSPAASKDGSLRKPLIWFGGVGGILVVATLGLWSFYGTAVFFEMVRAGWAACF